MLSFYSKWCTRIASGNWPLLSFNFFIPLLRIRKFEHLFRPHLSTSFLNILLHNALARISVCVQLALIIDCTIRINISIRFSVIVIHNAPYSMDSFSGARGRQHNNQMDSSVSQNISYFFHLMFFPYRKAVLH